MNFKPLGDRIAVTLVQQEEKAGSIIIPDTMKEKPIQGKVVSVGDGNYDDKGNRKPLDIKVGDLVVFGKWAGTEIKIEGQDLLIMKESDVMGKITN